MHKIKLSQCIGTCICPKYVCAKFSCFTAHVVVDNRGVISTPVY